MNKRNLSVVMAGAMLATSIAPVMAAEEKTLTESELTLYAEAIKAKMEENKIDKAGFPEIFKATKGLLSQKVIDVATNHLSAIGVKIDGANAIYDPTSIVASIKNAKSGSKIEIVQYETTTFHGLLIPGSEIKSLGTDEADKYTESDFKDEAGLKASLNTTIGKKFIKDIEIASDKQSATITLHALDAEGKNKTVAIKVGEAKLDTDMPMSGDNLLSTLDARPESIQQCDGFMAKQNWVASQVKANPETVIETVNVVADEDETVENLKVSDLYDGTILTARGTEILNDLKYNNTLVDASKPSLMDLGNINSSNGVNSFVVKYYAKGFDSTNDGNPIKTIKVTSTNLKEIKVLHKILSSRDYVVGVVGGSNRYATAVSVAKQQDAKIDDDNKNIVLVNGDALVDGLSAAPLAATINGVGAKNVAAPILLSKADTLPKETVEYLNKLTEHLSAKQKKSVVVTLVGGESVLTSNLEDELTAMGFKVDRLGGDNREETSLEVAEVVAKGTTKEVFVVGAEGEADAMAISAVAARDKKPIIVAKAGGISKDALKFLGKQNNQDAWIIGGTAVFSKEDEAKISKVKEDSTKDVKRLSGENRTETNAKILEKYYATAGVGSDKASERPVILAKDGMTNGKYELVDALTAANLGGPIVLAKDKLSTAQESAILKAHAVSTKNATQIMQVGEGLNSEVIKSVSKLLGLANPEQ